MPIHRPVYLLCMHLPNTVLMCACRPFLSHASSRRMGSLLPLSLFLVLFRKTPVLREFNSIICRLPVVGGMVDPHHACSRVYCAYRVRPLYTRHNGNSINAFCSALII